jgi:hypothetical protein
MPGEVVRGELRRHAAPAERQSRSDHRHLGPGVPERAQQIGHEAGETEADEHQRDRQLLRGVAGAAWGREQTGADHADHDGAHREVLVSAGVLAEHPLAEEHQHQQARGERWLHDHQGSEQQGHDLQRPAEHREPGAEQPARPLDQSPGKRQAQVLLVRRLLGVHRLKRDP